MDSREEIKAALAQASGQMGFVSLIVHSAVDAEALLSHPFEKQSYASWLAVTNRSLKRTLFTLQAAFFHFTGNANGTSGGSVVTMGPAFSLVGARSLVALCTLAEGQRSLVKSAARQWGKHRIRVNWLALAPESYPGLDIAKLPTSPENGPPPPALGHPARIDAEGVGVLSFLASDASTGLTGQTLNLDGGVWMVP
jgi:NAD(P)-dependent dehydrogenase (short-subunit alcohol dehydrogenase family)